MTSEELVLLIDRATQERSTHLQTSLIICILDYFLRCAYPVAITWINHGIHPDKFSIQT
jgi:hypothetical protein